MHLHHKNKTQGLPGGSVVCKAKNESCCPLPNPPPTPTPTTTLPNQILQRQMLLVFFTCKHSQDFSSIDISLNFLVFRGCILKVNAISIPFYPIKHYIISFLEHNFWWLHNFLLNTYIIICLIICCWIIRLFPIVFFHCDKFYNDYLCT